MGEVPEQIRQRFRGLKLPPADVLVLADELPTAQFFDTVIEAGAPAKAAANWIMGDIMAYCKVCTTTLVWRGRPDDHHNGTATQHRCVHGTAQRDHERLLCLECSVKPLNLLLASLTWGSE